MEEQGAEEKEVPKSKEPKKDNESDIVEPCNTTTEATIQQKSQWGNEIDEAPCGKVSSP